MEPLGKFDSRTIEERILKWWDEQKIYDLIKKAEPKDKVWRFIDGPPYTTGDVHLGTAWNKILKDYLIRYKRMQGYRVTDTPGYDTHGLPIEVVIEKKLGIKNKKEILDFGLDKFISECRTFAESKIGDMNNQFKRLGCTFWNWDVPYVTLKNTYIQGIWWTLKEAWKKNYLYKFFKPQNCCPRCATALAKHEFEYETVQDNAIYVKFRSVEDPKTYFLIWTTTPWTLVSNTNIMVNPDNEYGKLRVKDETWIMGMAATSDLLQNKLGLKRGDKDGFEYLETFNGSELEGKRYIHPLIEEVPDQAALEKQNSKVHTIILSREYVKEGEGVGLVHTAPGHGPEDFEVGMSYGIPIFSPVDMHGKYTDQAGKFAGKTINADINLEIIELLQTKGTLVHKEKIEHEYAHCWRCHTKLVYRATEQWFFKTSALREKMLAENDQIYWVPKWAGEVNFKNWLSSIQDWCISRQRFWGIPLSIWICDNAKCGETDVIGSIAELKEKSGTAPEDVHIPWIDRVTWTCSKCKKGTMKRVPDVLDVWLDSGSVMWASQFFTDGKEHYDSWVPADFILEGKDQIRGWFNSLLCSAMVSSERKNYAACYMHGWVMSHGTKMSKSLGNAINPPDVIEGNVEILTEEEKEKIRKMAAETSTSKFDKTKEAGKDHKKGKEKPRKLIKDDPRWSNIKGIETFRFYSVMGTPAGQDLNFDYKEYTDTFKIMNTLWNSYLFAQEKMKLNNFDPNTHTFDNVTLPLPEKWILSRTNSLIQDLTELFDKYELPAIPARLQDFILNDLSRWYITIIRDRVEPASEDPLKYPTLAILWYVLYRLTLVMAPVNPMLTEEIYQKMFKSHLGKSASKSIHLQSWPPIDNKYVDKKIEGQMSEAREIVDDVRSLKTENKIKLRWPTKALYVIPKEEFDVSIFKTLIEDNANVKEVKVVKNEVKGDTILSKDGPKYTLFLDTSEDQDLQEERIIKDLLRTIQFMRKQNQFTTGQEIHLMLSSEIAIAKAALEHHKTDIIAKVTAAKLELGDKPLATEEGWTSHIFSICLEPNCFAMVKEAIAKNVEGGKATPCNYCETPLTPQKLGKIYIKFQKMN